ncbi:MAG: DUF308 domain-containing protein [Caulobacterales bacterium]|nr:DUF308 domain-containing protein [Caulobacterales bacterium]
MTDTMQSVGRGLRMVSGFYGILMIILGAAALALPVVTTLATVLVIGICLIAGGAVGLFASFQEKSGNGRWLNVLWSLLAIGLGIWMVAQPGVGAVSLTLLLGAVLVARGITGIMLALDSSFGQARIWLGIGGLLSLILGGMVLFNLMDMVGWTIGTFVGIDFLVTGVTILLASMMGPRASA